MVGQLFLIVTQARGKLRPFVRQPDKTVVRAEKPGKNVAADLVCTCRMFDLQMCPGFDGKEESLISESLESPKP